ncbi:MAG TPA: histidine triad nucleotide-binding protein [Verrucomicrobiae bacterium]|nr:histidine triad nucleotide-binding protein [Verrucomicrobiae bacterium]
MTRRSDDVAKTLFEKIIDKEIPATIIYEDEHCVAFKDIQPAAPTHVLLVPRKVLPKLSDAGPDDQALLGHLLLTANKVAAQLGVGDAFRLTINNGAGAGQSVFHLHLHIIGGRPLKWPPG